MALARGARPSNGPRSRRALRSQRALHAAARAPPPRRGRWSQDEVQLLKDWYGLRDNAAIARDLQRTPDAVQKMADVVFRAGQRSGPWSAQEVQDLKKYLGASTDDVIAQVLGRDVNEIRLQITELGRLQHNGRWTRDETNELPAPVRHAQRRGPGADLRPHGRCGRTLGRALPPRQGQGLRQEARRARRDADAALGRGRVDLLEGELSGHLQHRDRQR